MIEKIEVARTFIVYKDFLPLSDISLLIKINSVYIPLQQCFKPLSRQIEFRHTIGTEQVHFTISISGDA